MQLSNEFDIYSDYLIVNQGQVYATDISSLLDGHYSHDKITRSLSKTRLTSKELWQIVKPHIKPINNDKGVLIIDDTIEEKPYMAQNDLICYHYDHVTNRSVKGINQLTVLYHNEGFNLPVGYELIEKKVSIYDAKKKRDKRVSETSKQEHFRNLIQQAISNNLLFSYILCDKWFASVENINYIDTLDKHFIMPLKNNRKVALSKEAQLKGEYQPIGSLVTEENQTLQVWIENVDFPLNLSKQLFKDEDAEAVLYLITNDLMADTDTIKTQYQKRWNVETFYKSIKSNLGYANSPTHTVTTQNNHLFLSMVAFVKLELLKTTTKKNHFAMKRLLAFNANRQAWKTYQSWKNYHKLLNQCA